MKRHKASTTAVAEATGLSQATVHRAMYPIANETMRVNTIRTLAAWMRDVEWERERDS